MALITVTKNIIENSKDTFEISEEKTIQSIIDERVFENPYETTYCECYDVETGLTTYEPVGDGNLCVLVLVNGKDAPLDYVVQKDDSVEIFVLPEDKNAAITGGVSSLSMSLAGASYGFSLGGWVGFAIGAIVGGVAGFLIGYFGNNLLNQDDNSSHKSGIDTSALPDIRGASNQLLLNNPIPVVLGKHITTPFIVGSPYNLITGTHGHTNYIKALYLVGYSPLKITDVKLGDRLLARNQKWTRNEEGVTIYHGSLRGSNSESEIDVGDIASAWDENDITVEILQQGQNEGEIDYGSVYPYARIQDDIEANVLYIVDGHDETNISYKGVSLKNGLRNNCVKFTRQYPLSATVELNFASGLYKTWTHTEDDGDSYVKYGSIPLWTALQWRVYSRDNEESDGDYSGVIEGETDSSSDNYWWDSENELEKTSIRGWHSFKDISNNVLGVSNLDTIVTFNGSVTNTLNSYTSKASVDGTLTFQILLANTALSDAEVKCRIYINDSNSVSYTIRSGEKRDRKGSSGASINEYYDFSGIIKKGEKSISFTENVSKNNSVKINSNYTFLQYYGGAFNIKIDSLSINDSLYIQGETIYKESIKGTQTVNVNKDITVNKTVYDDIYDETARAEDVKAHSNNKITASLINNNWLGATVFNFKPLCGSTDAEEGLSEFRVIAQIDFEQWARKNFTYSTEEEFIKQFKAYFMSSSNTMKSVEIRCVRLSPNYIDETSGGSKNSAASYSDIFTWKTLSTEIFDNDKLTKEGVLERKRPLSEDMMRKCCLIAVSAKTDNTDNISNSLAKLSCIAQSFSPYYDDDLKQWFPKKVNSSKKYFKPNNADGSRGEEITEEQFIADRQNGIKSIQRKNGNDFTSGLINNVLRIEDNIDSNGRYIIPNDKEDSYIEDSDGNKLYNLNPLRYCDNNAASIALLAGLGKHVGYDALSYNDYDMISLIEMYNFCKCVEDGSTYSEDGWHYDDDGNEVTHSKGEVVQMKFAANAYLYETKKLEDLLYLISFAGRATYTRSKNNKIKFVVDKEEDYPVALINQANTLSSSYSISYEEPPSGLQIPFKDENDGYETNNLYAMMDGETEDDHLAPIEQYNLSYVTNPYQAWSLGRYILANRILGKEKVTKKVGMEGYSIPFGSIVKVQDDTMLLGTDYGARITRLIEDDSYIYGFLTDRTYHYDGTLDDTDRVRLGVVIMQPGQFKESRVITLRLAPLGTNVALDNNVFTVKNGETNVVIFEKKIAKNENVVDLENSAVYKYNPQVDNVVGFGHVGNESALYRVAGVKSDSKHNFELTLLKYQPEMFNYGKELPSFQNNITPRNVYSESYNLSSSASTTDVINALNQVNGLATEAAKNVIGSTDIDTVGIPDDLTGLKASASENGITLTWTALTSQGLRNTLGKYIVQVSKDSGETWSDSIDCDNNSYTYSFDRSTDGYPEADDLNTWQFRIKAVNAYNKESENWCTVTSVSTSSYGTWQVQAPVITEGKSADRRVILTITQPSRSDSKVVYGTVKYRVQIKRDEFEYYVTNSEGEKETVTVDADTQWYKPATNENPYTDENNYKNGDGYVESDGTYIQVVSLYGQGSTGDGKNLCDTPYIFRVQAYNTISGNESEEWTEISVTATVSALRDIVKANETFAQAYITELSAITANLGEVSQGSMGSSKNNYWILSTKSGASSEEDYEGAFRVGGDNQYLMVTPVVDGTGNITDYTIKLKAANIEFTSDSSGNNYTDFKGGTYVYNTDKTQRLSMSYDGIRIELNGGTEKEPVWSTIGKVYCDSYGNMILTNATDKDSSPTFITAVDATNITAYHFDNSLLDNNGENAMSAEFTGNFAEATNTGALLKGNVLMNEDEKVAELQLDTVQSAGFSKVLAFTNADYLQIEKQMINLTDETKDKTLAVEVNDLNSKASTSWGLTSSQVEAGLFKKEN